MSNKAVMATKINNLIKDGRAEITTREQLEKYPIGSTISYLNINNVFRSGGFITKFCADYFIYTLPDFETKYRTRYSHIQKMWIKNTSIIPAIKNKKTNFPVKINDIVVYYGIDNFDAQRFQNTEKYKKINGWYEYFEK